METECNPSARKMSSKLINCWMLSEDIKPLLTTEFKSCLYCGQTAVLCSFNLEQQLILFCLFGCFFSPRSAHCALKVTCVFGGQQLILLKPEWGLRVEAATSEHVSADVPLHRMWKAYQQKISGFGELCPPLFSVSPSPAPSLPFAYLSIMHEWTPSQNCFYCKTAFYFFAN